MTNVTFIFETSPNIKPKEKCGGHGILYPHRLKKWGWHVPHLLHLIAPMNVSLKLNSKMN